MRWWNSKFHAVDRAGRMGPYLRPLEGDQEIEPG
jgi:hypothetical protein